MHRPVPEPVRSPIFGAVIAPIRAFFALEAASGLVLFGAAAAALLWVNLGGAASYEAFRSLPLTVGLGPWTASFTLRQAIDDGLMTLFFLLVGMEIKRELVLGELRNPAQAALPAVAALGGMLVPAALYAAFNHGGPGRPGWGIPMATDIAFCIGVLTLLRARVPHALTVFLTALAIFDDIGGIIVIAVFYGSGVHACWLLAGAGVAVLLAVAGRTQVGHPLVYAGLLAALWYALHHGGVHPSIAGVVTGLAVPARTRRPPEETLEELATHAATLAEERSDEGRGGEALLAIEQKLEELESPLGRFVHALHPWVAFGIMPAFALASSGVDVGGLGAEALASPVVLGTAVALVLGKFLGISAFTLAAVRLRLAAMPGGASVPKLLGVAAIGGIGFTVALFIAGLAFPGAPRLLDEARLGILAGSLVAGLLGSALLLSTSRTEA
mgnify:CR=1 FL=1